MRLRRFLGMLAAAFVCTTAASAAEIKPLDLGKGSEVWFAEDHTVPIVAATFSFPAGSAYDPAGRERGWLPLPHRLLIDEGAGGLEFQRLPSGAGQPRHPAFPPASSATI